jgi:hypothetical protein
MPKLSTHHVFNRRKKQVSAQYYTIFLKVQRETVIRKQLALCTFDSAEKELFKIKTF